MGPTDGMGAFFSFRIRSVTRSGWFVETEHYAIDASDSFVVSGWGFVSEGPRGVRSEASCECDGSGDSEADGCCAGTDQVTSVCYGAWFAMQCE